MTDFKKILLAVAPHGKPAILDGFSAALPDCISYADISTPDRLACFIGQCAEESAGFQTTVEYASGAAYEGRKDLGNVQTGDGRRFKGRGLIQLTGRANYGAFTAEMDNGVDYVANPERVAQFPEAAYVADRYWKTRNINAKIEAGATLADKCRIATKAVNGGYNGLSTRQKLTQAAALALKGWSAAKTTQRTAEAISDPNAALVKAAAQEKAAAKAKGSIAGAATLPVVAAGPAAQASAQAGAGVQAVVFVACGAIALAVGVWALLEIRRHENAAQALAEAAKS